MNLIFLKFITDIIINVDFYEMIHYFTIFIIIS